MSNDDVTVTDRDRAAGNAIAAKYWGCAVDVGELSEYIALALAQARSEGREESKRVLVGDEAGQYIADVLDGLVARFPNTVIPVGELSKIATNLRIKCPNTAEARADAADEALRVAREALEPFVNLPISKITIEHVTNATRAYNDAPTTASTKTDANEFKEDLVEFLQAAWDPNTGFTNGNSFYRLLGPLYEKYCGAETAQEDKESVEWDYRAHEHVLEQVEMESAHD